MLLYAIGNHFQSVLPLDDEVFIRLVSQLESENQHVSVDSALIPSSKDCNANKSYEAYDKEELTLDKLKSMKHKTAE